MRIDNTRCTTFQNCPLFYYERFEKNLERIPFDSSSLELGKRMHQLWEEHHRDLKGDPIEPYPSHTSDTVELEAQTIMAAYRNAYPVELFEVLDVERTFEVPLPDLCPVCFSDDTVPGEVTPDSLCCNSCGAIFLQHRHSYIGKFDGIVRDAESGFCQVLEHKTEARSSKRNDPRAWAARTQASMYLWAAQQIYGEPFRCLLLNVARRPSEKGQCGPEFPPRQHIERSPEQLTEAVRNIVAIADQIETCQCTGVWVPNRNQCFTWYECDHYMAHTFGWSDELLKLKYRQAESYLDL